MNKLMIINRLEEISELAKEIKKMSFPLCENDNYDLQLLANLSNKKAHKIQELTERLLRSGEFS